jgi:hypothetical protein
MNNQLFSAPDRLLRDDGLLQIRHACDRESSWLSRLLSGKPTLFALSDRMIFVKDTAYQDLQFLCLDN